MVLAFGKMLQSEFRIKEINWQRKEDQLLNEYQSRVEDLNHENFALKAQVRAMLESYSFIISNNSAAKCQLHFFRGIAAVQFCEIMIE